MPNFRWNSPVPVPYTFFDLWSAISDQKSSARITSSAFTFRLYEVSTHWHILHKGCPCAQTPYHKDIGTWRYTLHTFLNSILNVTTGRRSGSFALQIAPRTGLGHTSLAESSCSRETHCWHQNFSASSWKPPQIMSCKDYSKRSTNIRHMQYFYRVYSSVHSLGWCTTAWNVCVYNPFTKGTYSNTLPYLLKDNKIVSGFSQHNMLFWWRQVSATWPSPGHIYKT